MKRNEVICTVQDLIDFANKQPKDAEVRVYERLWGTREDSGICIDKYDKQIDFLKTRDSY